MQRVLEPEYMDTQEEAGSYAAMDHSIVNGLVVDRFLHLGGGACRRVIDLGTGPGDIPILLSKRSQIPAIVGVDAAETMLALARPSAARHGVADRVTFARADVKALPYADGALTVCSATRSSTTFPSPLCSSARPRACLRRAACC